MRIGNIRICKNVLKSGIIGTCVGALIGSGVTYFVMTRKLKDLEEYTETLEAQLSASNNVISRHMLDLIDESRPRKASSDPTVPMEFADVLKESDKKKADILEEKRRLESINEKEGYDTAFEANPKYTLQEFVDELDEIEDEFVSDLESADDEGFEIENVFESQNKDELEEDGEFCLIRYDIFANTNLDYKKTTLGYYALDDILTDENDDIIDDREYWIGEDSLNLFGVDQEGDPDVIYIRNYALHHDYEIVRYTDLHYQEGI